MAIKKSDLYSSLWASCDELRGGMDASQYKDYVLFMLFIKYISDKYGSSDDFAPAVVIPPGASFKDMVALKGKSDIGDKINTQVIQPLIDGNTRLARSDFPDFNDPIKLGEGSAKVERLSNLIGIFQKPELDFSGNHADNDDILGDAYEYLMRHFATESGKSKGQFYTPSEVSRVIAKVLGIGPSNARASTTAYDPTCGSGSLLLKVAAEAGTTHITLEGQEMDVTTAGLARMNMILHDFPTASILTGNTLADPKFKDGEQLRTYDYVVANPPFSVKTWSTGLTLGDSGKADPFQRFAWGVPPAKQGDYAFLLHIIRSMKGTGQGACILPHGVLFRGNAEATIRRQLVRSGFLKGIIGLPANLFYGTGIPACILVLDKAGAAARSASGAGIFMIDASKGFIKDGNKNRLREQDIHRIVDTFARQTDEPRYARLVPLAEIADARNDFNLNLPRYIDSSEPEDLHDITAHLRGGIPERDVDALAEYWRVMPGLRQDLFAQVQPHSTAPLPAGMHPAYAETHFSIPEHDAGCPDSFAILTAYAITGEQWTPAQNEAADAALAQALTAAGHSPRRITGYSPTSGHAEPGWLASMPFDQACELGQRFKQDALYYVHAGTLYVSHCDQRRALVPLSPFAPRLHVAAGAPVVRPGYAALCLPMANVKPAILGHAEFRAFNMLAQQQLADWRAAATARLKAFDVDGHPKALIEALAEELLASFEEVPLIDAYDVYQHLMDYAAQTLQDDLYLIAADGWVARTSRILETDKKGKTRDRGWTCDLIPKPLIVARYFAKEQAALDVLQAEMDAAQAQQSEMEEEHGGEDGVFNGYDSITAAAVKERVREIGRDPEGADEVKLLEVWMGLSNRIAALKKQIREGEMALDTLAYEQYPKLGLAEVQSLLIDDKWMATLAETVQGELDRVSQTLTGRIRELAGRYATPLPNLSCEVDALAARVEEHLARMGALP